MPESRKKKDRKAAKRAKRKQVGNRSADSGQFVTEEFAEQHPGETVAVTRKVEPAPEVEDDSDPEC